MQKEQDTDGAEVIQIIISRDNMQLIALVKESDECMIIMQFSNPDLTLTNEILLEGNYIVATEIEQNEFGNMFAVPYLDTDSHHLCVFNRSGILFDSSLKVQQITGIDRKVIPMIDNNEPMAVCCFTKQESIFYAFFDMRSNHMMYFMIKIPQIK